MVPHTKTTFVTIDTLKVGVKDAVLCFNDGMLGKVKVLEEMCGKAGLNCMLGLKKQDLRSVTEANKAMEVLEKRPIKQKEMWKGDEDVDGDSSYGAGLF